MRRAIALRPETRLLDAGCGLGRETSRLAADHPGADIVGLDRNAGLLEIARHRTPQPPNVRWPEGDLTALDLPDASFDAIRAERVLMYPADGAFERVIDELTRLLRHGGRLGFFELDSGATILAPGSGGNGASLRAAAVARGAFAAAFTGVLTTASVRA